MKLSAASLLFLILCSHILSSKSKLQQQPSLDEDEDDDDWDDDEEDDESDRKTEIDDDGRIYKNPRNSPSAMCPRDEEQTEILGQKCLRKCSTDEDCKSKKKKCRCDGACGMSCIKPDRECPELTDISHATMTVTGKLFGDRAHYICDPDYFTVGLSERTCRADGHWTGDTPSCKKDSTSFCKEPPKIKNARHNALIEQTTFNLDSTVKYFCYHGYAINGIPKAKCLMMDRAASWFGPDITCEPQSCGPPTDIPNGWHAGECYTYDCRVSYHCADGYELVGRAEKICLADGTWLPKELPQCVQVTSVQCPPPESPRHGKAVYTSCAFNSIVSYECKYGFTIVGAATRRCGADRRWSGQTPTCKEINCGNPGVLYNGWIENIESGTGLGASIIFRCKEHMKLEGNTSSVCQSDGRWRYPLPHCLAPCVVPQISKGHIMIASHDRDHINNVTVVEHGETLLVVCVQNYEFAANNTPVVCNNGTWSIIPKCSPARCKMMPRSPRNGMVIAPKTEHGMRAVFQCKDGYELKGTSRFVECSYGNWTGEIPSCQEVFCPFPGYIDNGKVLLVGNMGVYDYRPYVKKVVNNKQIMYDCNRGFVLSEGPPGATCIGGNWSPRELPQCIPGLHPRLRWSRRRRSIGMLGDAISYRDLFGVFRKMGRKLLHLYVNAAQGGLKHRIRGGIGTESKHGDLGTRSVEGKGSDRANETRGGGNLVSFLRVFYRKLSKANSKHGKNVTGENMRDVLSMMSENFFRVRLGESDRNVSAKSIGHERFRVKSRKEFSKLKKNFERMMKFYEKSVQWKGKPSHRKHLKITAEAKVGVNSSEPHEHRKHKAATCYKGFYNFIIDYLEEKLTQLEAQNATEELIRKMNISKFTIRNGTTFTLREMYAFFKHIIENKLHPDARESNIGITGSKNEVNDIIGNKLNSGKREISLEKTGSKTESSNKNKNSPKNNKIPQLEDRNVKETGFSFRKRNLLALDFPLSNQKSNPVESERDTLTKFPKRRASKKMQSGQSKRFFTPSEIGSQLFLKNAFLNAYEDEYRANVKRSISRQNRTSWTSFRKIEGSLEEYDVK